MNSNDNSIVLDVVKIEKIDINDRVEFHNEVVSKQNILEIYSNQVINANYEIFKMTLGNDIIGYVAISEYKKREHSKFVNLVCFNEVECQVKKDTIIAVVNYLSEDRTLEYIYTNILQDKNCDCNTLEELGFIRTGLNFNNELNNTFNYYNIYKYKLI